MSNNTIYVFVKGHKNKYAYIIVDSHFKAFDSAVSKEVTENIPSYCDWHAMIDALNFIQANKGKSLPEDPVVKIFTSYEKNFDVASGLDKSNKFAGMFEQYIQAKRPLERGLGKVGDQDDSVRVYFLPKEFKEHMKQVIAIMDSNPGI